MSSDLQKPCIVSVAVPVPLRNTFDFIFDLDFPHQDSAVDLLGYRVKIPFGARQLVGVIVEQKSTSDYPFDKLKKVLELLDSEALFEPALWRTLNWLSRYYLAPIGEVFETAMTQHLRQGKTALPPLATAWRLSEKNQHKNIDQLSRAPLQRAIVERCQQATVLVPADFAQDSSAWRSAIRALITKGWLEQFTQRPSLAALETPKQQTIQLNAQQTQAVAKLHQAMQAQTFSCTLLQGVTGSGKTQVYFEAMQQALQDNQQVLFLVPEIGLTPQLIERVQNHFAVAVSVMHSALNATERHLAWWHAHSGNADIVIGTRSAVFSNFTNLGLIVIDEEHDGSFKQNDGVRYQARDVAIYRAKQHNIPIILGSATPSLESYANALDGRFQHIKLTHRATTAPLPTVTTIDLTTSPARDGLSPAMLHAMHTTLKAGQQVMLFLNRRGYAPVLFCTDCGKASKCHRCDSNLTVHRRINRLCCHHCGYQASAQRAVCEHCNSTSFADVGEGTQRVEQSLQTHFPDAKILRIDRDSTRRKGELAALLNQAKDSQADILLGTQLITKGHDFPNVTLVGIIEADQGLVSADFRASESLFQQIVQVAGRAGRRDTPGQVLIQTRFAQHPLFAWVKQHNYDGFAQALMAERQSASFPPYGFFALLRAESVHPSKALQFLRRVKHDIYPSSDMLIMDAVPAPMERRAGKYRAQLLITASQRATLNNSLNDWLMRWQDNKKLGYAVRWSIDIDPLDHY